MPRRGIARGRVFPQFYSTDRRFGRLSVKAVALFPLMWANADDQGRLSGDPEEIKYSCCPNIDPLTKTEIPELLQELERNKLIKVYDTPRGQALQLLDWWEVHPGLQWAWPSQYPPSEGWQDHLRYKKSAKEVVTVNWFGSGENSGEQLALVQVRSAPSSPEPSGEQAEIPLTTPLNTERGKRKEGEGKSPEPSGEKPPPSPAGSSTDIKEIQNTLLENFRYCFGTVKAANPKKVIPREPTIRELTQMRDLAAELVEVGGCPLSYIREAFREAGRQTERSKWGISYVRAILFDWLGVERVRSP